MSINQVHLKNQVGETIRVEVVQTDRAPFGASGSGLSISLKMAIALEILFLTSVGCDCRG